MVRLPVVTSEAAVRVFGKEGFIFHRQRGSHIILRHPDGRHLSVPGGRRELKPGTLRALIRKAGITVDEFVRLLD